MHKGSIMHERSPFHKDTFERVEFLKFYFISLLILIFYLILLSLL